MENKEIEVRFLEIDKEKIISRLKEIGAKDLGNNLMNEIIFDNKNFDFRENKKLLRLRKNGEKIFLSYKHYHDHTAEGTEEVEIEVSDFENTKKIIEQTGLMAFRIQEKWRHTFVLDDIVFDIDTWPKIPTLLEIESLSEEHLKKGAEMLNLSWEKAVFMNQRKVIEEVYNIPVSRLRYFTFDKME